MSLVKWWKQYPPVSRASDDDALLKAMVSKPNQERLIEDEDIRANLLRQRMAAAAMVQHPQQSLMLKQMSS